MRDAFWKCFLLFFIGISYFNLPLHSEIERVTVRWNPAVCTDSCVHGIQKELSRVGGVAEMLLNREQVDIRWKPKVPFLWQSINTAIRTIGAPILEARVQVRGTIIVAGNSISLQSLGDNTQFVVLSSLKVSSDVQIPQTSFETNAITPELYQELAEAARDFCVVTISGRLLRPQMGLYLVAEQVNVNRLGLKPAVGIPQRR
ncbi:MAG: hypothetical protein ACXU9U_00375 [Parachlamydiaceae bacterium]